MALYKEGNRLTHSDDVAFDKEFTPGIEAPWAGIYRCINCGDEISIAGGHKLPPQNHHQHPNQSKIVWKLLVHSVQKK